MAELDLARDSDRKTRIKMVKFVSNREIYEQVVRDRVPLVRKRLWIATADIKDMYVDSSGRDMVPFLEVLSELIAQGVEIRLIHAKEPGPNFREDFDRYPRLFTQMERVLCPRVHFKCIIIDGTFAWFGSANLTGAGMGAKSIRKRNFENGVVTDDSSLIEPLENQFDAVWRGDYVCRSVFGASLRSGASWRVASSAADSSRLAWWLPPLPRRLLGARRLPLLAGVRRRSRWWRGRDCVDSPVLFRDRRCATHHYGRGDANGCSATGCHSARSCSATHPTDAERLGRGAVCRSSSGEWFDCPHLAAGALRTANRSRSIGVNGIIFVMSNLYRSSDEKVIAGVCAGLAHKLDLNMTGLRWVVALVTLFLSGIPAIVYIVLWAILKPRPTGISPRSKTCREAGGYAGCVIDV